MESPNVNRPADRDPLEPLLRQAAPAIADEGFSARVMAAVDEGRRRTRIRWFAIAAGAAAGLAVAATAGAFGPAAENVTQDLQRSFSGVTPLFSNPNVVVAAMISTAALIYVFRRRTSGTSPG